MPIFEDVRIKDLPVLPDENMLGPGFVPVDGDEGTKIFSSVFLKNKTDKVFSIDVDLGDWQLGSFNDKTMADDDSDKTVIRTSVLFVGRPIKFTVNVPAGYDMFIASSINSNNVFWFRGFKDVDLPAARYIRFAVKKSNRQVLDYDTANNIFKESGITINRIDVLNLVDVKKEVDSVGLDVSLKSLSLKMTNSTNVSSSTVNSRFSFFVDSDEGVFIKSFKPLWTKATGVFYWRFIYGNLSVAGSYVDFGEDHVQNIGDEVVINSVIDRNVGIYFYSPTAGMRYVDNSADPSKNGVSMMGLLSVSGKPLKVSNVLKGFSPYCVFAVKEKSVYNIGSYGPNVLSGKTISVFGDSMVAGDSLGKDKTWLYKLGARNCMPNFNFGINATYMSDYQVGGKDNSIYQRICVPGSSDYVVDDFILRSDYILIFAGTNDCNKSTVLGNYDSTNPKEFCGALNSICDTLQTRNPKVRIGFITPYRRAGIEARCENYINAIKVVCAKYGIPVFDNGTNGGINWNNSAIVNEFTTGDSFHLNEAGMEFVSRKYEAFLKSL